MNSNLKGKKLLILGGIQQMLDLVTIAHDMGVIVYETDIRTDVPCAKVVDKAFNVSATDINGVVKLIKAEKIDGVITGYVDMLLPYYAEICRESGLPSYATKEQFDIITDKQTMKKVCSQYGIPVPHSYTTEEINLKKISYPVIVKPVDSSGSRGCSICYHEEDLCAAIETALAFSKKGHYIVEDYITGGSVLLQYYIQDGDPVLLCCSDTYSSEYYYDRPNAASCGIQPSRYTDYFLRELHEKYCSLFKGLGLRNGPIEISTYVKNDVIHLGDIGYRLCGGRMHYLTDNLFNINFYRLLISFALTGKSSDVSISSLRDVHLFGKKAAQVNFSIIPGTIHKIIGVEKLKQIPEVFYSTIYVKEGFCLHNEDRGKLIQTVGRVRLKADTYETLVKAMYKVFNAVDFLNADGDSLKMKTDNYSKFIDNYN